MFEAVDGCTAITWRDGAESLAGEAQHLAVTRAALVETNPKAEDSPPS